MMFGNPEEIRAQMQEEMDRMQMQSQDINNQVNAFLGELNAEQLMALRYILIAIATPGPHGPVATATYFEGQIVGILIHEMGLCAHCGREPHDDPSRLLTDTVPDSTSESTPVPDVTTHYSSGIIEMLERDPDAARQEMLDTYGVDSVFTKNEEHYLGVLCKNCGMRYPSMKDRMLKEPEDCSGCHQKAKWG